MVTLPIAGTYIEALCFTSGAKFWNGQYFAFKSSIRDIPSRSKSLCTQRRL